MLFLEGIEGRQQYGTRINQVLLLIARMGIIAMLAIALAQPVLRQWGEDADAGLVALRAADRGELLSIGGAIVCGAMVVIIALLLMPIGTRRIGRFRFFFYCVVGLIFIAATLGLGRRAVQWDREVRRLIAQQPQMTTRAATDTNLRPRVDAAILLDCSSVMDFEEGGHTRFSLAQGAAKQVLAGLHRGDQALMVLLGRRQSEAELEPTTDLQLVADRIDAGSYRPSVGRRRRRIAQGAGSLRSDWRKCARVLHRLRPMRQKLAQRQRLFHDSSLAGCDAQIGRFGSII